MSKHFNYNSLFSTPLPLPCEDYFLIVIDTPDSSYIFWEEVVSLIKPHFSAQKIDILVIDNVGKFNGGDCITIKNVSWPQIVYLCQNSVQHIGADNYTKFLSDKWLDFFSVGQSKFNDFSNREIDDRNPSDVANLIIGGSSSPKTVYFGVNSRQSFIEYIPSSVLDKSVNANVVLRLDKERNTSNALESGCNFKGIIFDKIDEDVKKLILKSERVYCFVDNISLSSIKDCLTKQWFLICKDSNIISKKRCEFIDYKVIPINESRRGILVDKDLSDTYCESYRRIWKDGTYYNSHAHVEKGLTFSEKFDIIDTSSFWEGQDFLRIYAKR